MLLRELTYFKTNLIDYINISKFLDNIISRWGLKEVRLSWWGHQFFSEKKNHSSLYCIAQRKLYFAEPVVIFSNRCYMYITTYAQLIRILSLNVVCLSAFYNVTCLNAFANTSR